MAGGLNLWLNNHISDLKDRIKIAEEQLNIFGRLKKGTIIYSVDQEINTASSGVSGWLFSYEPSLLKYNAWNYCDGGFALEFEVLASQDSRPHKPPYQPEYSGRFARIKGPKRYGGIDKFKIVPVEDMALYINYYYKSPTFEKLLKANHVN